MTINSANFTIAYEQRAAYIATHAWETWTRNGLGLDDDDREQTGKTALDAAINAYLPDMDDGAWLAATIARLTEES